MVKDLSKLQRTPIKTNSRFFLATGDASILFPKETTSSADIMTSQFYSNFFDPEIIS